MSIHLKKPYKIIQHKHKRYSEHYKIPAENALVVPLKEFGAEVSCDVRWEDGNGELHVIHQILFTNDNIMPLNPLLEDKLHDLWLHYYGVENDA
jgi:hypothetical protein